MNAKPELVSSTPEAPPDSESDTENPADTSATMAPIKAEPLIALVVEDEEIIGSLLVFILERQGFKVEWKKNGRNADRFIHHNEAPTIVLLDIDLPDIDGYGLLGLIRARPSWRQTPVIMLTAMSEAKDVAKAVSCGADDYLLKPFNPADLIKRVHKLCRL